MLWTVFTVCFLKIKTPLLCSPYIVAWMGALPCCGNLTGENTPPGETSNPLTETGGITWVMMECSAVHFVPWRHNLCSMYLWVSLELLTLDFKQKRKSLCSLRPTSQSLSTLSWHPCCYDYCFWYFMSYFFFSLLLISIWVFRWQDCMFYC